MIWRVQWSEKVERFGKKQFHLLCLSGQIKWQDSNSMFVAVSTFTNESRRCLPVVQDYYI